MEETAPNGVPSADRTLALLTHLSGIFFWFLPPLIVYLVKKDNGPWIRRQAAEALNFQLTVLIAWIVSLVLILVVIGFVMIWAVGLANLVLCIIAAIKANDGVDYRYPLAIRFVS
jgi:uncharacterized Tic20 family protein